MLTKSELNRIATLMAKADSSDMNLIASMFNDATKMKSRMAAAAFAVGDKVTWNGKAGTKVGTIEKVNRKNIVVKVNSFEKWNVTASLLKKV